MRRLLGGILRVCLARPPLTLGLLFTGVSELADRFCVSIEGPLKGPTLSASTNATPSLKPEPAGIDAQRAARVLFARGFDTVDIAELLTMHEADVSRWVCRRGEERRTGHV